MNSDLYLTSAGHYLRAYSKPTTWLLARSLSRDLSVLASQALVKRIFLAIFTLSLVIEISQSG